MPDSTLAFDILARDKASAVFKTVGGNADGLSSKLRGVGKVAAVAIGGAAVTAVAGLGAAMVQGVKDAIAYETLGKRTAAVIESTGNKAGISVKGVQSLAGELESLSGVDENLIINGENVLATFTNIRNVGKDRIFDQATRSALDMSSALGTDLQGATIQIGKALNDPIKGITALSKVGVSFTQQQKDQIKAMVAAGDTMGAQKLILSELNTEFGGAAKAAGSGMAGSLARLKDSFSDAFRDLGTKFLPYLADFAAWLSKRIPGAIDTVMGALSAVAGQVTLFWNALRTGFTEDEGTPIEAFALMLREHVLPVVQQIIGFLRDNWQPVLVAAGAAVLLLISPFALVVAAVIAAYVKFEWFRDGIAAIAGALSAFWEAHAEQFKATFASIVATASSFFEALQVVFAQIVVVITDLWDRFGHTLLDKLRIAFNAIVEIVRGGLEVLTGIFDLIKAILTGKWGEAWDAILKIVDGVWDTIVGVLKAGLNSISLIFEAAKAGISAAWSAIWNGIATLVTDIVIDPAKSAFDGLVTFITGMPSRIAAAASGMWDGIKSAFKATINWVIDKWNKLEFPSATFRIPHVPGTNIGGDITIGGWRMPQIPPVLHGGGMFKAPTPGGEGLALLRDREQVTTPETMSEVVGRLDALIGMVERLKDQQLVLARTA